MRTVTPHLRDTHLIRTPHYYGQFALSVGKESPYIFSTFGLKCHMSQGFIQLGGGGGGGGGGSPPPPG